MADLHWRRGGPHDASVGSTQRTWAATDVAKMQDSLRMLATWHTWVASRMPAECTLKTLRGNPRSAGLHSPSVTPGVRRQYAGRTCGRYGHVRQYANRAWSAGDVHRVGRTMKDASWQ
jgi:hypothetical protein